jgi:PrcB C-terminal
LVRWRTVASGSSSTETKQKLQLASQQNELDTVWTRVLQQSRTQPIVDFSKDRCVILFLGTRNTGGYSAQVTNVVGGGGSTATIVVNELFPGPRQAVTQSLTSPWVMIAIDRTLLDLSARFTKTEDNSLPSYSIAPGVTYTQLPWNPCGYGYGGSWSDPCGYGFDSPYEFESWCNQNNFDSPYQTGQIDFRQNRLVFISAGDYGLGYSLQIGDIFIRGGETVVQVRRNGRATSTQRSYLLVSLGRESKKYNVEYLVSGNDCFVEQGRLLPLRQPGAWVFTSQRDWDRMQVDNGVFTPDSISKFDYAKSNLGIVYMGELPNSVSCSIDRVAYRGQTAMVYMRKIVSSNLISRNVPYFVLKFDRKVRNIKVVDL